jgi:hypothetical protein
MNVLVLYEYKLDHYDTSCHYSTYTDVNHLLAIPRKSNKTLSFSYNLLYLFYLGASILITFIFFSIYKFFSLLVSRSDELFVYYFSSLLDTGEFLLIELP